MAPLGHQCLVSWERPLIDLVYRLAGWPVSHEKQAVGVLGVQ